MFKFLLVMILSCLPIVTYANEQEDAVKSCLVAQEAIKLYDEQNHIKYGSFNPAGLCQFTTRSKDQWGCITQSIINGNAPYYSQDQCFRRDPNTIMIGKDEQHKAMEICLQVADFVKDKPQIESAENIREVCSYHRFAHNTQEWFCVREVVSQDGNFHFAASKCLINPPPELT
jgi:hypothetical protein